MKISEHGKDREFVAEILVPCLGGLLAALPFNIPSLCLVGWAGMSLPFFTLFKREMTKKRVFRSLFCCFYTFYFVVYSWFANLYPLDFAGLGNAESVAVTAFAMLFLPAVHGISMTLPVFAAFELTKSMNCFVRAVFLSLAYTSGEYFQSLGTFAFPWARLFVGQTGTPVLLQSASLFGSYFITFVMVLVNILFALFLVNVKENRKKSVVYASFAVGIFAANLVFGCIRMYFVPICSDVSITAAVLQGNMASGEKWEDGARYDSIYKNLASLLKKECDKNGVKLDFVLMPETAYPVTVGNDEKVLTPFGVSMNESLKKMASHLNAPLGVGAFGKKDGKSTNSVFVYYPDGRISEPYNKQNLVPFGEFVPYRSVVEKLFPSLGKINMLSEDVAKGEPGTSVQTHFGKVAFLVCFDSIFSETARCQVKDGARIIAVSTNDSWYKTSKALDQHASHTVMRAIENGTSAVRSANTGISMIIDPLGRIVANTQAGEEKYIYADIPVTESVTLYTVIGDAFVYVCIAVLIALVLLVIIRKHLFR